MKQAVVLIHGIGEQVPMDTLRGFVQSVWITDLSLRRPNVPSQAWSKPDHVSGDFELRRLTTAENRETRRTDFFEFYWAHMMEGTEVGHLLAWAKVLLFRAPSRVPEQLRGLWYFFVIATLVVLLAIGALYLWADSTPAWLKTLLSAIGSALWIFVGAFVVKKVAGDAARYLHVAPPNIESRRRIREAGVKLLETLHSSGKYDRIIVAGHSLGTVIGYDVLTYSWARYHDKFGAKASQQAVVKLETLEQLARKATGDPGIAQAYQKAQSDYFSELKAADHPWLVTDFVTMGSPLAHASLLMARDENELAEKKQQREFPTCPPVLEEITVGTGKRTPKFTFASAKSMWIPHHAAVFAPTRWTNLYFPCRSTLWGDIIGGPVAPVFGWGIRDIPVETDLQKGLFTHSLYWAFPRPFQNGETPLWIQRLREAMRICLSPAQALRSTDPETKEDPVMYS